MTSINDIDTKDSPADKLIASSLPTDTTFNTYTAGQMECHFIKAEEGYCLQYFTRYNGWADGGKASENVQEMRKAGQTEEAGADYWD